MNDSDQDLYWCTQKKSEDDLKERCWAENQMKTGNLFYEVKTAWKDLSPMGFLLLIRQGRQLDCEPVLWNFREIKWKLKWNFMVYVTPQSAWLGLKKPSNVIPETFNKWHVSSSWELSLSLSTTHLSRSTRAKAVWLASEKVWCW